MPSIVALFSKSGGWDGANWISGKTGIPDGTVAGTNFRGRGELTFTAAR